MGCMGATPRASTNPRLEHVLQGVEEVCARDLRWLPAAVRPSVTWQISVFLAHAQGVKKFVHVTSIGCDDPLFPLNAYWVRGRAARGCSLLCVPLPLCLCHSCHPPELPPQLLHT